MYETQTKGFEDKITPEFKPVEIGALAVMATPVAEAGSPMSQLGEDVTSKYME